MGLGIQLIYVTFLMLSAIIPSMNRLPRFSIVIRVLAPLVLISLIGITPRWRSMEQAFKRAQEAIEKNDNWQASLAISQAARQNPWRRDLWEQAGILALKSGQHQTAQSHLEHVLTLGALSAEGLVALGDAAQLGGDHQAAIQHWEQALSSGGDQIELHSRLVETYRQLGDLEKAIQYQTALVELNPTIAETNYTLGLMLAASEPEAALSYLTLAEELNPDLSTNTTSIYRSIRSARILDDQAYLLVSSGQALASIEEWDLAANAFSNALLANPEYADAWAYLGEAFEQIGKDGSEPLERATTLDPNSIAANTLTGLYWQRRERFELALIYLHAAANLDPTNPALQAEVGNTLGLLGNISAAETHYQRAVEFAPRDPIYWRTLANFYIKFETKLREEGLAAARQAVILNPSDPASLDVLAQIYLLMDSPFIARRFLERALDADPQYAPAHIHLGLIYILEGNSQQAYHQFNVALSLAEQGSPTAEQAGRLLETYFP